MDWYYGVGVVTIGSLLRGRLCYRRAGAQRGGALYGAILLTPV
jgi:hypothetical protein